MGTPDDILIYDLETYLGKGQFKGIGVVAAKNSRTFWNKCSYHY